MKHLEIERRFVLYPCSMKRFLKRDSIHFRSYSIVQFYLVAREGEAVRYRRCGRVYTRTVKRGSGLVREESEEPITKEIFDEAFHRNSGGVIRKRRYVFSMEGLTFELDSFKKPLKGLNILEVEFARKSDAERFKLPEIFRSILVSEVTGDTSFTNGAISRRMKIPPIESPLSELLKEVDKRGEFLKASVSVGFGPYESGAHALKAIIYSLVKTVHSNRAAILEGSQDPERLHQLRVAMRKMRALFSQLDGLFDPLWLQRHKERVASLMRVTGEMRDMDVYIEEIEGFREMLPKRLHDALDRLERHLISRQKSERKRLHDFLLGEAFCREIEELGKFAETPSEEGLSPEAATPVILPVKKALRLRYAKILKKGSRIDEESPAHRYHEIRIDIKKLRYMMEFFSPIFDEEAYRQMMQRVKSIQTILGKHQDLDVQSEHLKSLERQPDLYDEAALEAFRALLGRMSAMKREKRLEFRREFADFSKTGALFGKMVCKF
ncbi:adenylate cyclase [Hydrogenimonas sp.]|nr:adenylate cyclase [Hydrogenimonas sp.]